jgi:membrane protein required for colicin V production
VSALDIFVIILLLGGGAVGFVRGFVYELFSLLAWAAAIAMIKLFHSQLSIGMGALVDTPPAAAVLAFALLFVPTFVLVKMLARSIGGRARRSILGPVDRALGGGFGLVKGLLAATLFFLFANLATDLVYGAEAERPEWMTSSRTFPLLNASGRAVVDWVETRRHANEEAAR